MDINHIFSKEHYNEIYEKLTTKLSLWIDSVFINLPNIIIALLVFTLSIIASKYITKLTKKLLAKSNLQKSMKNLIARGVSIFVILIGLFLILGVLNLSKALNTILAGAGVAGLAVGLALQGALANTYSGILLSYVTDLRFGDWIKTNDFEGEVVDIDLRVVTLKQIDNNLVYIPNKLITDQPLKNFSQTPNSRVILECGVAYDSDLPFVRKLCFETILKEFDDVTSESEMIFLWKDFGDSSINFELRFWIKSRSALEVANAKSEAIMFIKKSFDDNSITIPFPIRTLDLPKSIKISS